MAGPDGTLTGQRAVTASVTVTNTGSRTGTVTPQAYLRFPTSAGEPAAQLKGFDRVTLAPGESRRVSFALDQRAFSVYEPAADQWKVRTGAYQIRIADSATDPGLTRQVTVTTTAGAPRVALPSLPLADPGRTITVAAQFVNDGTQTLVAPDAQLTGPAGWPVRPTGPSRWEVTVPVGTRPDSYRLTATLTSGAPEHRATSRTTTVLTVPYPDLAAAANHTGVTTDDAVASGDLDGRGHTLSATELAAHGVVPGATVNVGGVPFTWPTAPPGQPDNVGAYGQTIRVAGSGTTLSFLATSTSAPTAGRVVVRYANGTTSEAFLRAPDWWSAGAVPAVTFGYVNAAQPLCAGGVLDGTRCRHDVRLYALSVPVDPARQVVAVTLPTLAPTPAGGVATIHVFAATLH
ncbi:fibronectin type III-like domain-contianing protein [Longispora sp. K20-0274]|uniref:fibronectin type III-like domain-contianing protein n=1 Tax=Longispora sp. K20-0274 TaxID=3088255 RepID=UPI00399A9380